MMNDQLPTYFHDINSSLSLLQLISMYEPSWKSIQYDINTTLTNQQSNILYLRSMLMYLSLQRLHMLHQYLSANQYTHPSNWATTLSNDTIMEHKQNLNLLHEEAVQLTTFILSNHEICTCSNTNINEHNQYQWNGNLQCNTIGSMIVLHWSLIIEHIHVLSVYATDAHIHSLLGILLTPCIHCEQQNEKQSTIISETTTLIHLGTLTRTLLLRSNFYEILRFRNIFTKVVLEMIQKDMSNENDITL
jgi:hypothetical protein